MVTGEAIPAHIPRGDRVVRRWTSGSAVTGEGARVQTADGTVWCFDLRPGRDQTGVQRGYDYGAFIKRNLY